MRHAELKVMSGKQAGSLISLPAGNFLIGREEDCHLRPNSDLVSRHHCVFTVDDFAVRVRDLGSTNGTLVNGERIRGGVMLNEGDVVSIGKIEFQILLSDPSLETAAEMSLETETQTGHKPVEVPPEQAAPSDPATNSEPIVVEPEPESSPNIPATTDTMSDMPTAQAPPGYPPQQFPTGDTQFGAPNQMPMQQPALGYPPQMGYPPMMPPYGYPGFQGMYPQQMGFPPMQGGYPQQQMPMQQPPVQEQEPEAAPAEPASSGKLDIRLPNPEETGVKPPEPKPESAGEEKQTAEAKSKEEAPKMADDIIQQYLKRRPSTGKK